MGPTALQHVSRSLFSLGLCPQSPSWGTLVYLPNPEPAAALMAAGA